MKDKSRIIFLYTIDFPFGNTEPYLFNELPILCEKFEKVIIIPSERGAGNFDLPKNVNVIFLDEVVLKSAKRNILFRNIFFVLSILFTEFKNCRSKSFFRSRFRLTLSEILEGLIISNKIFSLQKKQTLPIVHYSFWMNKFVLSLSILKQKKIISHYVFRVHGFDLYEERRKFNYIPFRERNYKYSSGIFAISKMGLNYIRDKYSYSNNATYSYLGTLNHGSNPYLKDVFTIVSCSAIIGLKRLDLLANSIALLNFPVKWYHFGDGKEDEKNKVKAILKKFSSFLEYEFRGQVSQATLFDFYKKTPVSVFVNLSETEGLPVSIMEAISFSIPIIATDVGGTSEIVTSKTGLLLPKDCKEQEVADMILEFKNSTINSEKFRMGVKEFWTKNFSAEKNYHSFCEKLLSLN